MTLNTKLASVGVLCLATLLGACGGASVVTGSYAVSPAYSVTLGKSWSLVPQTFLLNREVKYLTIDGPLLNNFYLTDGLAVGRSIVRTPQKSRPMPVVKAAMSETEMAEFVIDTVAAFGYERVTSANLRPSLFGSVNAVRFDLTAATDSGLEIDGIAQVAEKAGKLHVMVFLAPREHYFGALKSEVESVFSSATLRP
jgi:hypothetical protein